MHINYIIICKNIKKYIHLIKIKKKYKANKQKIYFGKYYLKVSKKEYNKEIINYFHYVSKTKNLISQNIFLDEN